MVSLRFADFKILLAIVRLVAVDVMNLLAGPKPSPQLLFGHKSMLIGVTSNIGQMVIRADSHQNVAI
jgi:hypothetical protein